MSINNKGLIKLSRFCYVNYCFCILIRHFYISSTIYYPDYLIVSRVLMELQM